MQINPRVIHKLNVVVVLSVIMIESQMDESETISPESKWIGKIRIPLKVIPHSENSYEMTHRPPGTQHMG